MSEVSGEGLSGVAAVSGISSAAYLVRPEPQLDRASMLPLVSGIILFVALACRNSEHNLQREFCPGCSAIRGFVGQEAAVRIILDNLRDYHPAVSRIHEIHSRHVPLGLGPFKAKINVESDGLPGSRAVTRDIQIRTAAYEYFLQPHDVNMTYK